MSAADRKSREELIKEANDFYLPQIRKKAIDAALEQLRQAEIALNMAQLANSEKDNELTESLLRFARRHTDEQCRQLSRFDPA